MEFGPYNMMMDFALISILLFISQFLRAKVKFIQNLYLPSSLMAGFLGLFLGPQFLKLLPFSEKMSGYPYMLIVFLFASLFIGSSERTSVKKVLNKVGDTFTLNLAIEIGQFGLAMCVGALLLKALYPNLNEAFALMMPAGFVGGHGYAAAIGGTIEKGGWAEAVTVGQTFATIGLLTGVIGGMICINFAVRKGATRFIKTMNQLPESMRTGLVPEAEQESLGKATTNPMAIETLTWHCVLILIAMAGGYYGTNALQARVPASFTIPMMSIAMIAGVILQFVLKLLRLDKYVDKQIITRIGSSSTDYLVAFGVATIKISVVMQYAVPILIMALIGLCSVLTYLFIVSRKLFHNFWFERGIFIFGWATGVVAIGVTLLRVVDPDFRSKTLEDYGMAYTIICFIEVGIVSIAPMMVMQHVGIVAGAIMLAIALALIFITAKVYGVNKQKMDELRPGEKEAMEG